MNRRSFLQGLLASTAVVAVRSPVYASGGIVKGLDLAAADDLTVLTLRYQNQIAVAAQIPARLLRGGWPTDDVSAYFDVLKKHQNEWQKECMQEWSNEEHALRPFSEQSQKIRTEAERTRQEAWRYFAEWAERRRRWQADEESVAPTIQISNGESK